jgi:choline-sulfatase
LLARISGFMQRGQRLTVIVTADHGEDLTRFERHHGTALDDGGVHVPLVLSLSDDRVGRTIATPVSSVDVMPTVLAELGVAAPRGLDGIELRRVASGEPLPDRIVISETWRYDYRGKRTVDQVAATSSRTSEVFDILDQDWLSGDGGAGAAAERRSLTDYLEEVGDPDLGD